MIKYSVEFSREAKVETGKAAEYYDRKVPGLSSRFFDDITEAIQSISNNPLSCHHIFLFPISGVVIFLYSHMQYILPLEMIK
jgi:hypothetical protein